MGCPVFLLWRPGHLFLGRPNPDPTIPLGLKIPMELAGGADVLQLRRQQVELSYAPLRNTLPDFDCMILEWLVRWHPMDRHYLLDTPLPYPFMPTTPAWVDNN